MKSLARHFGEAERKKVANAVFEAEARTSAEIVPVASTASGRYDRAEDIVGVITGLGAMVAAWLLFQREPDDPAAGGWDGLALALPLWALVALVIAGFAAGAALAAHVAWLRRLFVPVGLMATEVRERAAQLFHDQRVRCTRGEYGILVYLSLFERRAVILADTKAFEALGQEAIDAQCRQLTAELKQGDVAAALCAAIGRLGELLANRLPRAEGDRNELADALVTVDLQ